MKKMSSTSLLCFAKKAAAPVAMAAALCMTTACAHHSANSVPPEKAYGTGIGEVSDPAKINDNGSSSSNSGTMTSGTYSTSSNFNSSQSSSTYSTSDTTAQTTLTQGTPTTTSSTTVRQVALPNSTLPCDTVTTATRPASAVTFYTLDPVSGIYLPAGTMSSAPSGSTTYYTYDTGNGWYTTTTSTTSGGTQIYIQDPSANNRMVPAGYAVITTRPCGSAYVVTTTTTTSTPVNVSTTTNNSVTPPPPPMTSSASTTVYTGPTIRPYSRGRSSASLDLFATRMQFTGANHDSMTIPGTPGTGAFQTEFQRQNGWGMSLNGRLTRMAELSVGASYLKPQVNFTPTNGGFGTLSGGDLTVIPATASLRFHLLPEAFLDPYLGGGATYMAFRGKQNFNVAGGLGNTGLASVNYDNSWGWHAEGGLLLSFAHGFGINANARYQDVKVNTTTTFNTINGPVTGTFGSNSFRMKPWQFSLGLRFGF